MPGELGLNDGEIHVTVDDIAQVLNYKCKSLRYAMNLSHCNLQ